LRDAGTVERLDLDSEVEMTHLRHQMTFNGSLELTAETGEMRSFFGEGRRPAGLVLDEIFKKILDDEEFKSGVELLPA